MDPRFAPPPDCPTLLHVLDRRARDTPDQLLYRFLESGDVDGPIHHLTAAEVAAASARVAAALAERLAPGERALIVCPKGPAFSIALFGALRAGVVAVPANPPGRRREGPGRARLAGIIADCQPRAVLTTSALAPDLGALDLGAVICVDALPAADGPAFEPTRETLAVLQYTSGSTAAPRGVMLDHGNLMANGRSLVGLWAGTGEMVCWAPDHHDMGLTIGTLQPVFSGITVTAFSPTRFLEAPQRWMRAMAHFRASLTVAPDFALALAAQRTSPAEAAALDLSCVARLGISAEPVRAATLDAFAARFAPAGFRRAAFHPCYGLAEATLLVSGGPAAPRSFDPAALATGRATLARDGRRLVNAGPPVADAIVEVVDPASGALCPPGAIGELRVRGPMVARGYWGHAAAGPFTPAGLLTGDLGIVLDGEVFVTGRRKDLIIIRGANHYPQDLEDALEGCHPALRSNSAMAFGVEVDGAERLVIVAEADPARLVEGAAPVEAAIRQQIHAGFGLAVHAIALAPPRALPRTTSGKRQRRAARAAWQAGALPRITPGVIRDALGAWLRRALARVLDRPAAQIDPRTPFAELGLDSMGVVELSADLERHLRRPFKPETFFDRPTVEAVLDGLLGVPASTAAPAPSAQVAPPSAAEPPADGVAIIGLACRFPGADSPEAFWDLIRAGRVSQGPIPAERAALRARFAAAGCPTEGGWLTGVDQFDAGRFGVAGREAALIDPQQRMALELSVEALERAGIAPETLAGRDAGVFLGISTHDYATLSAEAGVHRQPWAGTGNAASVAANRISYALDLRGPSVAVDTACSASLTAIHLACRALRAGDCGLALVGGVNLVLTPDLTVAFAEAGMLAPNGRCKPFSADADGYARAEGGGVVVLKRLADARRDGDPILAVVAGSAVGQDGRSNGLTAPNGAAQRAVVERALADAGIDAAALDFVEAHGTGTPLGDPIEVNALAGLVSDAGGHARIGAVKANIGHAEAAAGIAGLIKAILALGAEIIPPQPGFAARNPELAPGPLRIPQRPLPWPRRREAARHAGISAFGFGGSLAHVVLTDGPEAPPAALDAPAVVPLAARSPAGLQGLARRLADWLAAHPRVALRDVAHTLAVGRDRAPCRAAIVAVDLAALVEGLAEPIAPGAVIGDGPETLRAAAAAWVEGGAAPVVPGRRIPLPATPLDRRRYWLPTPAAPVEAVIEAPAIEAPIEATTATPTATPTAVVQSIYDTFAGAGGAGARLTFGLLPAEVTGFSWLEAMTGGPGADVARAAQVALRAEATAGVDLGAVRRVLDFGCGYGTDLVTLAQAQPALEGVGFTLSAAQAETAREAAAAAGVHDRVRVRQADSARIPFPGEFELALGYEVLHHVPDKPALMQNLAAHVRPGGKVVLADFVAGGRSPVEHAATSSTFLDAWRWAALIGQHGFALTRLTDVSDPVGRFLDDPGFEARLAALPALAPAAREALISYDRLGRLLRRGGARYVLLELTRVVTGAPEAHEAAALAILCGAPREKVSEPSAEPAVEPVVERPVEAEAGVPAWLVEAVAYVLDEDPADLPHDTPLAELGMDSMMAAELRVVVEERLGREVPGRILAGDPDLNALARLIAAPAPATAATPPLAEAAQGWISRLPARFKAASTERPTRILLTGATGFVGGAVLDAFRAEGIEPLCLVRAADDAAAAARLPGRARAVAGDLTRPRLGLSPADYARLAAGIDQIVHVAADIDFAGARDALVPVNVEGTLRIIELAAAAGARLVHMSTLGVFGAPDYAAGRIVEGAAPGAEGPFYNGYAETKWIAEALVTAARARGLSARILRPGFVAGHGQSGASNPDDVFVRMLRGCAAQGITPPWAWFPTGLTPVDYVARGTAALALDGPAAPWIHHLDAPDNALSIEAFRAALARRGIPTTPTDSATWRTAQANLEASNPLRPLASTLTAEAFEIWGRAMDFGGRQTGAWLAAKGITAPAPAVLLERILDWCVGEGLLPEPVEGTLAPPAPRPTRSWTRPVSTPAGRHALGAVFGD